MFGITWTRTKAHRNETKQVEGEKEQIKGVREGGERKDAAEPKAACFPGLIAGLRVPGHQTDH